MKIKEQLENDKKNNLINNSSPSEITETLIDREQNFIEIENDFDFEEEI